MTYTIDLHTHTTASGHAYSTILEMVAYAKINGITYLGISDHAPRMPGSSYIYHFQNLKVVPRIHNGVHLLRGVEANILDHHGNIDMNHDHLKQLDYCIASLHPPCIPYGSKKDNTKALIEAMKNPLVNMIGHPDDARYPLDYEEVVKAAKAYQVLLEVNNASLNPEGFRLDTKKCAMTYLALCEKHAHPVIIGSDAHIALDVGQMDFADAVIKEIQFPKELIVNSNYDQLKGFLNHDPFVL